MKCLVDGGKLYLCVLVVYNVLISGAQQLFLLPVHSYDVSGSYSDLRWAESRMWHYFAIDLTLPTINITVAVDSSSI